MLVENKLGYFYVTAKSIIMEGYQFIWLRNVRNVGSDQHKAILMELKNFCCLDTAVTLSGGFSRKNFQFNPLRNG